VSWRFITWDYSRSVIRFARKSELPCLLLAGTFALTTTLAFSASPNPETIQATYAQNGKMISVTLTIDGYSNQTDMQTLSQAFEEGQDQALVLALSQNKSGRALLHFRGSQL